MIYLPSYLIIQNNSCYYYRYINDCIDPSKRNVSFLKSPSEFCARVTCMKDINPGSELFVDYGKWYWLTKKPIKL